MLSIGWTEMMLIAAIALIVVGPKDLPAMLQQVGKFAGQIRRMGNDFKSEINKAVKVDEIKDLKKSLSSPLTDVKRDIEKNFNSIGADGKVKPSGVIAPNDPNAESVVNEIREAAGMSPAAETAGTAKANMTAAMRKAQEEATAKVSADPAAANPKATPKKAAAKKPAAKKAAATEPAAKKAADTKPAATAPVAKKPAAKKPVAKKPVSPATNARRKPAKNNADGAST